MEGIVDKIIGGTIVIVICVCFTYWLTRRE